MRSGAYILLLLLFCFPVGSSAAECTIAEYDALVIAGKSANDRLDWQQSADIYSRMVGDCSTFIADGDYAKAYDALSVAQLMLEKYPAAIESAEKCLNKESRYNACMMTAAKAFEALGDTNMAAEYALKAAETEPYDDYSAAVVIYAKDFLRRVQKK